MSPDASAEEIAEQLHGMMQCELAKLIKRDGTVTVEAVQKMLWRFMEPRLKFEVHEPTEEERENREFKVTLWVEPPLISIIIPIDIES